MYLLIISTLIGMLGIFVNAQDKDIAIEGAQIRTQGTQGLRFVAKIEKAKFDLTVGENANFGILLVPQSSVDYNTVINKDVEEILIVPAINIFSRESVENIGLMYDSEYVYFSAVLMNIPKEFYGTEIIARAYVKNNNNYIYSDQIKRSVKFVAEQIIKDGDATVEHKECALTVLEKYEKAGSDILVNASGNSQLFNDISNENFDSSVLQNTYHRLIVNKKLNVAYLGGSVTSGVGISVGEQNTKSWRGLTTSWLRERFPNATITETNAAIGGTGSVFGAYRVTDDLKLKDSNQKPDLLFVEFAINDKYDSHGDPTDYVSDVKSYMETIVRTVREYSPYCDIVFCFVTDKDMLATEYPTLQAHKSVAEAYGIPTISLGARLVIEEGLNRNNWDSSGYFCSWDQGGGNMYYDIVHPSKAGYEKYGSYVIEYLQGEFFGKNLNPYLYFAQELPDSVYGALNSPERYFFNDAQGKTEGFTFIESTALASKGYLKTETNGAKVSFTFTGTGLQLWTYAKKEASTIKVTIDGVSTIYSIQRGSENHKAYRLASGLTNTEHTVTIEVISVPREYSLELRALLVEGDPDFKGVSFQSAE